MRRFTGIMVAAAVAGLFAVSNAQQDSGMMGGMGMKGMDSNSMQCMMMMHFMRPSAAFATQDGGFVVIVGNKIMKFDKDAMLKKEVEMKMDTAAMDRMMMKTCPMMRRGRR